jgi:Immunity protein 31
MSRFGHYDIVAISDSERMRKLGIGAKSGVVIGVSEPEEPEDDHIYAVLVDEITYMVPEHDLQSTGERVSRDTIYDGSTIGVTVDGNLVDRAPSQE